MIEEILTKALLVLILISILVIMHEIYIDTMFHQFIKVIQAMRKEAEANKNEVIKEFCNLNIDIPKTKKKARL